MNAPLCLSATNALLDYLVRANAPNDLDGEGVSTLDIADVKLLVPHKSMLLNSDALLSLQVFSDELHASVHSNQTKEGLSLFGILDHTRTVCGRDLLRQWLLRPSLDICVIGSRHQALGCFTLADNVHVVSAAQTHLRGMKAIPRALLSLRNGKMNLKDWTTLFKFTFHAVMLRQTIGELSSSNQVSIVQEIHNTVDVSLLNKLGSLINDLVSCRLLSLAVLIVSTERRSTGKLLLTKVGPASGITLTSSWTTSDASFTDFHRF
ncbi:MutS protein msh5 [Tulasnella sp. 403]|nr:MutS protein msh5 [Tulasnella sp. 403]